MKITVLGSGVSFPQPKRSSAGFWLETINGSTILLDCSASAVQRMAEENLDWANLDAIWVSHFHLDHVGGLPAYLFGTKYAPDTQSRTKPLRICGAKGLRRLIEKFSDVNDYNLLKQPFPVEIVEIVTLEKFEITPEIEAVTLDTLHTDESHAIHLHDTDGVTLVYTADTGFEKKLGAFAKNIDLFITECSFVENKPVETHLELAEAMFLAHYANPKKMMLTHFYPEWNAVDFQTEIAKFAPPCEIIEAVDGLRLEL